MQTINDEMNEEATTAIVARFRRSYGILNVLMTVGFLATILLSFCILTVSADDSEALLLDRSTHLNPPTRSSSFERAHIVRSSLRSRRASDPCSKIPPMRTQGLVTRKRMPNECKSFTETLRSPEDKRLRVKLDHAILLGENNFVQINDGQQMWYIDKSCAPCHEEHIQGKVITIEYNLTNNSRIQFRYTTNDNTCPFLTVMPPLKVRSRSQNMREIGAVSKYISMLN